MSQEMSPVFVLLAIVGVVSCDLPFGGDGAPSTRPSPKLDLALNSFKMCPDYLDVPSTCDDLSLSMEPETKSTLYIDGVLNLRKEIPPGVNLIVDIRKCLDEREVSCEKYLKYEIPDVCSYLPQQDKIWNNFLANIEGLEPTCPFPVGSYKMVEAPIDLSEYQNDNYTEFTGHWQSEVSFANEKERFGCILFDMTISLTSVI